MKKILTICWKDLQVLLHDKAAWILMLAAPFALTLALGAVTGAFSPQTASGLSEIPLVIINRDTGQLGEFVVQAFQSAELANLFAVQVSDDEAVARKLVEDDKAAALVLLPPGFSHSLLPDPASGQVGPSAPVEIYADPARPLSGSIVRSVVGEIVNRIETAPLSGQVTLEGLLASGRLAPAQIPAYTAELSGRLAASAQAETVITVHSGEKARPEQSSFLAYLAPSMAVFFLMYTVSQGGRSILNERQGGTLGRLLATPTTSAQVLAGKVLSIFASGFLQVAVLVVASAQLFRLDWGSPLPVSFFIVCTALAATGWGILLAAFASQPWQVTSIGTAMMLLFGILGGAFTPVSQFAPWVGMLGRITPNLWAMQGFTLLAGGAGLAELLPVLGALLAMAALLFGVAAFFARRRWMAGFARA